MRKPEQSFEFSLGQSTPEEGNFDRYPSTTLFHQKIQSINYIKTRYVETFTSSSSAFANASA